MTQTPEAPARSAWAPGTLFTPQSGAIAALAVALASLTGQNLIQLAISSFLGQGFTNRSLTPTGYYVAWGVATLAVVGLVVLLARPAIAKPGSWETHVARAAVLLAVVIAAAGLLLLLSAVAEQAGLWA